MKNISRKLATATVFDFETPSELLNSGTPEEVSVQCRREPRGLLSALFGNSLPLGRYLILLLRIAEVGNSLPLGRYLVLLRIAEVSVSHLS